MGNFLKVDGEWIPTAVIYVKENNTWVKYSQEDLETYISGETLSFGGYIGGEHSLIVVGIQSFTGVTYTFAALYDNRETVTSACTWSIISGTEYASIDNTGTVTIFTSTTNANVTVQAIYNGLIANDTITLTYGQGTTATTETEVVTDESGNTTTTTTTTVENEDGSSNVSENIVVTDESGNTIETTETNINNNSDGSYDSTSTTYDENGDPTDTTNISGDTSGNVSTQGIEYENGEPVVTGYTVDTSENPDGEKVYNADGVNTEYYAFDLTRGFVLHIHFYINFNNQPAGQDENHHNILTMKRATPSPWYGFQLRQTSTNKYIIIGTQFSSGGNTNTNISGETTSSANTYEYDLTITYNPTASTNAFVCYNNLKGTNVYRSNNKFPDIDDLKYLKVTIGYAMDSNGDPFRYSNIRVMDFSITRT